MISQIPVSEPTIGARERAALMDAFDTGWISSLGPNIDKTSRILKEKISAQSASLVSSGTTALHLALLAVGIIPGDEVIVPDLCYVAVPNSVLYCGAKPVFVDIEESFLGFNLAALEASITPKTKAIIAVHNYGFVSEMAALQKIAKAHGLLLIEDCAEAPFHHTANGITGSFGDIAIYSFFGNKIVTSGEGGAVASENVEYIERVDFLKNQSAIPGRRFEFNEVGYNYRMTNLQAAILGIQLSRIDEFTTARNEIFAKYNEAFSAMESFERLPILSASPWMFSLRLNQNAEHHELFSLMDYLSSTGIESRPYFQPHSKSSRFSLNPEKYPISNNVAARSLNIPTFSHMSSSQVDAVISSVAGWVTSK